MKYRAVIFDLDGTLVELRFNAAAAKKAIFEELARVGLDVSKYSLEDSTQKIFDKSYEQIKQAHRQLSFEELRTRLNRILSAFEIEALSESKLLPGAILVLDLLKNSGVKLGLVTNAGKAPSFLAINSQKLERYFETIVTRDEVVRLKPSGDGLIKALDELGVKAQETLFVGDSAIDVLAAREAGVKVASITRNSEVSKVLKALMPDYIFESLDEVSKMVLE